MELFTRHRNGPSRSLINLSYNGAPARRDLSRWPRPLTVELNLYHDYNDNSPSPRHLLPRTDIDGTFWKTVSPSAMSGAVITHLLELFETKLTTARLQHSLYFLMHAKHRSQKRQTVDAPVTLYYWVAAESSTTRELKRKPQSSSAYPLTSLVWDQQLLPLEACTTVRRLELSFTKTINFPATYIYLKFILLNQLILHILPSLLTIFLIHQQHDSTSRTSAKVSPW